MHDWQIDEGCDPRAVHAPEVLVALQASCAAVRASADPALLELARLRLADLLGVEAELAPEVPRWGDPDPLAVADVTAWPSSAAFDPRARSAMALTEQFAIDVTGVAAGPLGAAATELGQGLLPFVQGVYLLDLGQRVGVALAALFGSPVPSTLWAWPADHGDPRLAAGDPMVAIDAMMKATARLRSLDPVLRELVRLRGARHHQCRRCQSVRSVAAIEAGADEELLGAEDPTAVADLAAPIRAALALTDAVLVGRPSLSADLVSEVQAVLSPAEAVELVCYLVRNGANKIAVGFGADAAIVEEGHEYQVIAEDGDTLTVAAPA